MKKTGAKQFTEIRGPALAVDVVAFTVKDGVFQVLLLKAKTAPATNKWVLPGVFVGLTETLDTAAKRALQTKANIDINYLEQLYTFGEVGRDDRGRVVTSGHYALVDYKKFDLRTPASYAEIGWFPVDKLPVTGYDHKEIIKAAVTRIRNKLQYSNVAVHLLPPVFTLTQLQRVYEAVLARPLDKRNFRRKVLSLGVIRVANGIEEAAAHRPARLFRFVTKKYQEIELV
ncbi:MAG: NUDIX domain-containing protein [Patescibacteria group bacterium]